MSRWVEYGCNKYRENIEEDNNSPSNIGIHPINQTVQSECIETNSRVGSKVDGQESRGGFPH